jgi:DNA-binding transcriptional ArsR family regulator
MSKSPPASQLNEPPSAPAPRPADPSPVAVSGRPRLQVTDPDVMRAMAHPARLKIIEYVMRGEGATATECAEICGLSPSATSYHLRALAKFGLIEEADSRGDGRERVWRSAYRGVRFDAVSTDSAALGGADIALSEAVLARQEQATRQFLRNAQHLTPEWDASVGLIQTTPDLTAAEAAALLQRISALIDEYRTDDREPAADARRTYVMVRIFPEVDG